MTGVVGGSGKRATSCETLRSEIAAISSALLVAVAGCCSGDGAVAPRPTPMRKGGRSRSSGDGGVTVTPAMVAAANEARLARGRQVLRPRSANRRIVSAQHAPAGDPVHWTTRCPSRG